MNSGYYWNGNHSDWSYSASTTYGAAVQINDRISTINSDKADEPHTRVVWFSPIYRYLNAGSNPVKKNKKDCDKVKNKYSQTLADYRRAIREAGGIYISGTAISTKKEASSKDNLKDWLHPTKSYAKTLTKRATKKFEQLNNGELRIDSWRIVYLINAWNNNYFLLAFLSSVAISRSKTSSSFSRFSSTSSFFWTAFLVRLMKRISTKIAKAMMRKLIIAWMKLP